MIAVILRDLRLRRMAALGAVFVLALAAWTILYLNPPQQKPQAGAATGGLQNFVPATARRDFPQATFQGANGEELLLDAFRGRTILVNLWASWCPPCIEEMPTLARLQTLQGGEDFQVVTIAIEDAEADELRAVLQRLQASNLPPYRNSDYRLMATLGVRGLPTSLLLDKHGRELGRLSGPAQWDSPSALRLIENARHGSGIFARIPDGASTRQLPPTEARQS